MANTVVKIKRTSTAGKVPNTVNLPNAGELALNMTDGILYSTNGSNIFEIGANNTTTRVSNSISVGANLVINTSTFFVGNSTVNTTITSSQITNDVAQLDVAVYVGDNVDITTTGLTIGNSSINTAINSSSLSIRGIIANGSLGTAGQVLHSNGTSVYWDVDDTSAGGVTSVASGNGLTGGPITSTGTLSVLANNGITANSTGLFVTQGTGTVVNATGVHVNSTYIETLTANNTSFVGTVSAANVVSNAQLTSNLANYVTTTNLTNNLANYQTTAGLSANVATLTANNATNLGGTTAASFVQNTDSRTLSGNLVFSGANVNFTGNLRVTGGLIANGLLGSAGQVLTSNATSIYWSTPAAAVDVNAQYTWTNTHTFSNTITFNGSVLANTANAVSFTAGDTGTGTGGSVQNTTTVFVGNNTINAVLTSAGLNVNGTTVVNSSVVNASAHTIGTTWIANTLGVYHTGTMNAASFRIGTNFTANTTRIVVGSTVGLQANGTLGTAGEVLHSNGTAIYWAADDVGTSGVTSVASGNGLTGGPITSTGTLSVLANTGLVANATGLYVNSTYIGTLSANAFTSTAQNSQFNSVGVGTAASGTAGEIRATNNITAYFSDKRLKTNIQKIKNALEKLSKISGVTFESNEKAAEFGYTDKKIQVGVIAQEVEEVLPQVVVPAPFDIGKNEDGTEYSISGENYKTVQYEKLVPLLIQAIKEQQEQIDFLMTKISKG